MRLRLFYAWLALIRPRLYRRLVRFQWYQSLQRITEISPISTPFFSSLPKVRSSHVYEQWYLDDLKERP